MTVEDKRTTMPAEEEVARIDSVQKEVRTRMKQGENEAAKKQPWEPMQLRCVGRIGGVVEVAGQPKPGSEVNNAVTPPDGEIDTAV